MKNSQHLMTESLDFETHLERVKQIIQALNREDISLKDGLHLYKEAQKHLSMANSMLESAEFELKDMLETKNQNLECH